uniref:Phospholipase A1 n=1 Tax=Nicotiana sylvestris TaxID=4096 RepID=A0A1U7Y456_NICSY|nr:PREDICTED: uncharacterized protein LOC104240421 [Nicotiana sylvestris]
MLSKYAGSCRYSKKNLLSRARIEMSNPFKYEVTKYIYATSSVQVPEAFIIKSLSREAWSKESNWAGFVVVTTDEGKVALGRRDGERGRNVLLKSPEYAIVHGSSLEFTFYAGFALIEIFHHLFPLSFFRIIWTNGWYSSSTDLPITIPAPKNIAQATRGAEAMEVEEVPLVVEILPLGEN